MPERRWPFAGDRAVDRARQVAQTYREALREVAPERADEIDAGALQVGEHWVVGEQLHGDDEFVTPQQAADDLGCSARTVYNWVHEGLLPKYPKGGKIQVRMGDARQVDAARRESAN